MFGEKEEVETEGEAHTKKEKREKHERHWKEGGGTCFCIKKEEQGEGEGKKSELQKRGGQGGVRREKLQTGD